MKTNLIDDAIAFAVFAHSGTLDKAGRPYILHPLAVMLAVDRQLTENPSFLIPCVSVRAYYQQDEIVAAAVLHDVVEDEPELADIADIKGRFGVGVYEVVDAVSRRGHESYEEFISRLSQNPAAIVVKIADISHNLSRMGSLNVSDRARLTERYVKALKRLRDSQIFSSPPAAD